MYHLSMFYYSRKPHWKLLYFVVYCTCIQSTSCSSVATCNDFTVDKCQISSGSLLETVKDISEDNCQYYCDVIYKNECIFFIYDRRQILCELIQESLDDYINSCRKFGGPASPSILECSKSDDKCKVGKPCLQKIQDSTILLMFYTNFN